MNRLAAAIAVVLLAASSGPAADVPVSECGQQVPAPMRGVLLQDLDCASGPGVRVATGSSVYLNGFSIVGNPLAASAAGVECSGGCRVEGPGTVREFSGTGIHAAGPLQLLEVSVTGNMGLGLSASSVIAQDGTVSGNGTGMYAATAVSLTNVEVVANLYSGILGNKVTLESCNVSDNGGHGVLAGGGPDTSVLVRNSTIQRNGRAGIYNEYSWLPRFEYKARGRTRISESLVTDNDEAGVHAVVVYAEKSTFARNRDGISASRVTIVSSSLSENTERGLLVLQAPGSATGCKVEDSVVDGNGFHGVYAGRNARISGSQVNDNGLADCSTHPSGYCADVFSYSQPKLIDTTCSRSSGVSLGAGGYGDWDICSLD